MTSFKDIFIVSVIYVVWRPNMEVDAQLQQGQVHRKYQYKHSFKGPNLSQRDGTIPFWEISGDAIASPDQLRLAPSIRSKRGAAWNTKPMSESEYFEIELSFRVTGQGRIGADGLAVWYTVNKGVLGNVFGSNQNWNGLGIFFDSFDNDAQRNNPYVMAMMNDGTKAYDHNTDGINQKVGGCQRDFRNKPYPVKAKIEYYKNVLTVLMADGMSQQPRYEMCFRAENVFLPKNGVFGLSGATGGLADDHDVLAFQVTSLIPPEQAQPAGQKIPETEQKKFEDEFEKYWKEFEQEREKFKKEHPDKVKPDEIDPNKLYEATMDRELRVIFDLNEQIKSSVYALSSKLDEVTKTQVHHTQLLNNVITRSGGQAVQQGQQPPPVAGSDPNTPEILQLSRELKNYVNDIKSFVTDIHRKTSILEQKAGQGVGSVQHAGGAGIQDQVIAKYLETIKHDVEQIRTNQRGAPVGGSGGASCDIEGKCISMSLFLIVVAVQTVVFIMYFIFKGHGEKAKFY